MFRSGTGGTQEVEETTVFSHIGREVKSKSQFFYQVLIDSRDCPFIRAQSEAVTFLGNQENSRSMFFYFILFLTSSSGS